MSSKKKNTIDHLKAMIASAGSRAASAGGGAMSRGGAMSAGGGAMSLRSGFQVRPTIHMNPIGMITRTA